MRVEDIEIHVGEPDFDFTPVRPLEAKCEATTAFSAAPTVELVNSKLREMAASLGANAVIRVEYKSGISMTSWKSMKGTGMAVKKAPTDVPCPNCAELIKRAAKTCRFCGFDLACAAQVSAHSATPTSTKRPNLSMSAERSMEPLRATNNPQWWIIVMIALFLLSFVFLASM